MRKLYHTDIYIPDDIVVRYGLVNLTYTKHAQDEAAKDKIVLPKRLDTNKAKVIEVELWGQQVVKVLYRISYNCFYELVIAIIPGDNKVKTVCLNHRGDKHFSLKKDMYESKP